MTLVGADAGSRVISTSPALTWSPTFTGTVATVPDVFRLNEALCSGSTAPVESTEFGLHKLQVDYGAFIHICVGCLKTVLISEVFSDAPPNYTLANIRRQPARNKDQDKDSANRNR